MSANWRWSLSENRMPPDEVEYLAFSITNFSPANITVLSKKTSSTSNNTSSAYNYAANLSSVVDTTSASQQSIYNILSWWQK